MSQGKASKPLNLPILAPACFRDQKTWNQYRATAVYSASDGFTYCNDCTPERKERMMRRDRCEYPKTIFWAPNGALIGRRVV